MPFKNNIQILNTPPPYKGWISLSSDPDSMTTESHKELNDFIWNELSLKFSDSLFPQSFNCNIPNQLNLQEHPEYFRNHFYDTIHTWGDFMHSKSKGFWKEDAKTAIELLKKNFIKPIIWTDHSRNPCNIVHGMGNDKELHPSYQDSTGKTHKNFHYTLDLIHGLGIRYIWDGKTTTFAGQNISLNRFLWYKNKVDSNYKSICYALIDFFIKPLLKKKKNRFLDYDKNINNIYKKIILPGGIKFYSFKRYGNWSKADIDGLGEILNEKYLNSIIENSGLSIIYTHLGKKVRSDNKSKNHIGSKTRESLKLLKKFYNKKEIYISPTHELLDYQVVKDNIELNQSENLLNVISDGIRYEKINKNDINSIKIGLKIKHPKKLKVLVDSYERSFILENIKEDIFILKIK